MSVEKIAFTSCVRYEAFKVQPEWEHIQNTEPDYLLLLGDQIYMDYGCWPFSKESNGSPRNYSPDEFRTIMTAKYQRQWGETHFAALLASLPGRVFGIWDDHDFAWNNATGDQVPDEIRAISYGLFCKHFKTPEETNEIYQAFETALAQVIMLDVRSHARRPAQQLSGEDWPHKEPKNDDGTLLGKKQWAFLERELARDSGKPYTLICSGITLRHGEENWLKFPKDLQRLKAAIEASGKRVIFLSGDIHRNAFVPPSREIPWYELVSSGLAVNYLGLGIPHDDCHNWALLELRDDAPCVVHFTTWLPIDQRYDHSHRALDAWL